LAIKRIWYKAEHTESGTKVRFLVTNLNSRRRSVFASQEKWALRSTRETKPSNYAHNDSEILSHSAFTDHRSANTCISNVEIPCGWTLRINHFQSVLAMGFLNISFRVSICAERRLADRNAVSDGLRLTRSDFNTSKQGRFTHSRNFLEYRKLDIRDPMQPKEAVCHVSKTSGPSHPTDES
jgi:hypothetical protein